MRHDAHRVEELAAEELEADDALIGIVRKYSCRRNRLSGSQMSRVALEDRVDLLASDSTTWMRAPLPP